MTARAAGNSERSDSVSAKAELQQVAQAVNARLEALVDARTVDAPRLANAMRHALLAGGKRVRPALCVFAGRLFDVDDDASLKVGVGLECLHTYSLVHDDLPAMDDANERRGKPTVHRAFDEATAILAGDALQALAFRCLADPDLALPNRAKAELCFGLAEAAGLAGMCGGQMLDLTAGAMHDLKAVETLQSLKTGALIRFSCEAGAIAGGASDSDRERLRRFGDLIGAAFQIRDDLLDVDGDPAVVGKDLRRDADLQKATFVAQLGIEGAQQRLHQHVGEAEAIVSTYGQGAEPLRRLAVFIGARQN